MSPENENNSVKPISSYLPTMETLSTVGWRAANFSVVVFITSGLITMVHSPLNSFMLNQITHGRFLPETSIGVSLIVRNLYAGFGACFAGTGTRTAYMSGVKKKGQDIKNDNESGNEQDIQEAVITTKRSNGLTNQLGYYSAISLGELVVTHVPEVMSQLQKLNIIDKQFKWNTPYNLYKLSVTTSGSRFCFGLVNFVSLCGIEHFYAQQMPIDDLKTKHFFAGAASGMTAAVLSYPFSYYRDYRLSTVTVVNGQLSMDSVFKFTQNAISHVKTVGIATVSKQLAKEFCSQAPLRMARTGSRFALIAGVSAACGDEPLESLFSNKMSFFNSRSSSLPEIDKTTKPESNKP